MTRITCAALHEQARSQDGKGRDESVGGRRGGTRSTGSPHKAA